MRKRSPKTDGVAYGELARTFNLKYHQEQRFIMSCGDQIAEFSPEQFVETAVGVIKHHLDELPQDCRTISDNAINALIDEWKTKTQAL